jgi:hypothetical protein
LFFCVQNNVLLYL